MRACRSHQRPGFTLLEIILVMVIILIVAGLTIPSIMSMLADARITGTADLVRGRMAEARARAMEDGRPWKLGFIANTGVFQLAPEDSNEWNNTPQDQQIQPDLIRAELPKEIVFGLKHEDIFSNDKALPPGGGWETIAIFMPDGSARDDSVTYFGKPGLGPMRAKLRGLTGSVDIQNYKMILADQP